VAAVLAFWSALSGLSAHAAVAPARHAAVAPARYAAVASARHAAVAPARYAAVAPARHAAGARPTTFGDRADAAVRTLAGAFYHAPGSWNACLPAAACGTVTNDWGADALTAALLLRWRVAHERRVEEELRSLGQALPTYDTCARATCRAWSDVPLWDAVTAASIFEVTRDARLLDKARRAFAFVDESDAFALGACPAIDFQQPGGGSNALKTLETDANYIRAALLLLRWTGNPAYLRKAEAKYAAVRGTFFDPNVALYTVYVFDDGRACRPLRGRYFASVNGIMISAGRALASITAAPRYARDARATARAVVQHLSDPAGIFADLQAGNDIAGPLVEAMYDLAVGSDAVARRWLLAAAAVAEPAPDGAYGRFFDGPPPGGPVSAWSADGGLELAIAAGALAPGDRAGDGAFWRRSRFVAAPVTTAPAQLTFTGHAIALIGAIGAICCEAGHVRLFVDGRETFDSTGIWQNKSPASRRLPNSILWSWRWPRAGRHTIAFAPGRPNAKEGGSFIRLAGYRYVP
jgi:hypothetical protein